MDEMKTSSLLITQKESLFFIKALFYAGNDNKRVNHFLSTRYKQHSYAFVLASNATLERRTGCCCYFIVVSLKSHINPVLLRLLGCILPTCQLCKSYSHRRLEWNPALLCTFRIIIMLQAYSTPAPA